MSDPAQAYGGKGPLAGLVLPFIAMLIALAILLSLGAWQVRRLHWKEALIARVDSRLHAPPVPAPGPVEWPELDIAAAEYTPVTLTGTFVKDREIHVLGSLTEPKGPAGGYGYFVMTPFVTREGWTAYVNRGFVPETKRDPATRAAGEIAGETTVVGLLRQPHDRSWFMPGDNSGKNEWFSRDPALYAAAQSLPAAAVAPYLIDARFDPALPGGLPQGGETIIAFSNNHLQYVVTWFGLAAALLGVFAVFAWGRVKRR